MTYQQFIENILKTRGRFMNNDEYHERHHIVPRCMGGTNNDENLIDLFAREHFIAHKLLCNENKDNDKLVHAYLIMAFTKDSKQQRYELSPEEYEEARKIHAQKFSGANNPAAKQIIRLRDEKIYDTIKNCYTDNNISNTTLWEMLKQHREFMYYSEWLAMTDTERQDVKSINWDDIQRHNRSIAAKKAGNGGSSQCSQETREKIRIAHQGKYGVNVYCPELDELFTTIKEASDKYGINKTSIGYCLSGKQKHAGKHPITGIKLTWVKIGK